MRYLIPRSMSNEMLARKQYLFESVHLWTKLISYNEEYLCLEGFPVQELDIFFIVGHNYRLKNFFINNLSEIYENTIVAITCDGKIGFSKININRKNLYIPHQNKVNNLASLLKGSEYGFDFDLTESEIMFFNSKKDPNIISRLNSSFQYIH